LNDDPVVAGENASNLVLISVGQEFNAHSDIIILFGSGYAGLGYHGPSDDVNQPVDKEAAAKFNRLMATLAIRLADAPERPKWNDTSFFRRFVQQNPAGR
jgi:hypothetical protein